MPANAAKKMKPIRSSCLRLADSAPVTAKSAMAA
jgi:hypothetical protein